MKLSNVFILIFISYAFSLHLISAFNTSSEPCIYLALGQNITSNNLSTYFNQLNESTNLFYKLRITDETGTDIAILRSDNYSKSYIVEGCTQKILNQNKSMREYTLILHEVKTDIAEPDLALAIMPKTSDSSNSKIASGSDAKSKEKSDVITSETKVNAPANNNKSTIPLLHNDSSNNLFGALNISDWPWWSAPLILGALGALFMLIFAFYRPVSLDTEHKSSLSSTQIKILFELEEVDRIPTDISQRVKKSKSTVVEHLNTLCNRGLVQKISTPGKKFVFYRLTHSGRILILKKKGKSSLAQ